MFLGMFLDLLDVRRDIVDLFAVFVCDNGPLGWWWVRGGQVRWMKLNFNVWSNQGDKRKNRASFVPQSHVCQRRAPRRPAFGGETLEGLKLKKGGCKKA
jgi:hypothetical protein